MKISPKIIFGSISVASLTLILGVVKIAKVWHFGIDVFDKNILTGITIMTVVISTTLIITAFTVDRKKKRRSD